MGSEHPDDARKLKAADSPACLWSPQGNHSSEKNDAERGGQLPALQICMAGKALPGMALTAVLTDTQHNYGLTQQS